MPDTVRQAQHKNVQQSTQLYLRIAEIHDNVVVLKNGGLRAVLAVSSVNVNLKSEDEQTALAMSYQGFLNSLDFPIQILVRSKKLDISNYLDQLAKVKERHKSALMQRQVGEYSDYIKKLVEFADIMEKQFYVIIPHDPYRATNKSSVQKFWDYIHPADTVQAFLQRQKEFDDFAKKLAERVESIQNGLTNCGLSVNRLETAELIRLFYESYNPLTARNEKLGELKDYDLEQHGLPVVA